MTLIAAHHIAAYNGPLTEPAEREVVAWATVCDSCQPTRVVGLVVGRDGRLTSAEAIPHFMAYYAGPVMVPAEPGWRLEWLDEDGQWVDESAVVAWWLSDMRLSAATVVTVALDMEQSFVQLDSGDVRLVHTAGLRAGPAHRMPPPAPPTDPTPRCRWTDSDSPCTSRDRKVHRDGLCFGHLAESRGSRCMAISTWGRQCSCWAMRGQSTCFKHLDPRGYGWWRRAREPPLARQRPTPHPRTHRTPWPPTGASPPTLAARNPPHPDPRRSNHVASDRWR